MLKLRYIFSKALGLAIVLGMLSVTFVLAASGDLDTTFSGDGKLVIDVVPGEPSASFDVAVQSDGKIVAVGIDYSNDNSRNVALTRFKANGALDTLFHSTGKVITDLGAVEEGSGLVIDKSTGKIIVAGQQCQPGGSPCDALILRYTKAGALDKTFDSDGYAILDFGGDDNGSFGAVALQSDKKIVVGGYMYKTATSNYDFAIYRLLSTGALDTTFNGTGMKSIDFGAGKNDMIFGIAIQPADGKIIVAGETCDANFENCNFALARLNGNGSLDTSFNSTGKQITNLGANDYANAVTLQKDGKIVVAGGKATSTSEFFAVTRYNTNGKLDTTFAGTGKKVFLLAAAGTINRANSVLIQTVDQKIVVSGFANGDFAIARLTPSGGFDTSFHSTGKLTIDLGGDEKCRGLAIQPADGKYVLSGQTFDGSLNHWALARILP